MKYKNQAPKEYQIRISEFPLLPDDHMFLQYRGSVRKATVTEVGYANPEYVLGNPGDAEAKVIHWGLDERNACKDFLRRTHEPARLYLKESMWATLEFAMPIKEGKPRIISKTYFTHEILDLFHLGKLIFAARPNIIREIPRFS